MRAARFSRLVATSLLLALTIWQAEFSEAATISVDEDCTLSEAIHAANNDAVFNRCTAGDGEDTITLTGDVTLAGRLPTISSDMTIDGSNHTISGDDGSAIFVIQDAVVTLKNMTATNGKTGARGGAIHATTSALKLENVVVKDNWAGNAGGGIYARDSDINLIASQVNDNEAGRSGGAGLYFASSTNAHRLNIAEWSSFSGNTVSQDGGAIHVDGGIVTIDKSSFSDNTADEGGVIEVWNGSLKVENTTMSENHAREGGAINAGADLDSTTAVTLIHVTMANNTADERGAAIALTGSQATLSIANSIIAGETAEGVSQCHPGISEFNVISWVRNAISDGSCPLVVEEEEEVATGDSGDDKQTTTRAVANDDELTIRLAPETEEDLEAQNTIEETQEDDPSGPIEGIVLGEPRTYKGVVYYPLLFGSPAIDSADQEICEQLRDPDSDLVETTRPQGDACDIGAFELSWEVEEEPTPDPDPTNSPGPPEPPRECIYVIVPGDSLTTIAARLSTTVEELRLLNRLEDDLLSVGQVLEAPGCAVAVDPFSPESPYICIDIPFEIFVKSSHRDVRCELVASSDIDKHRLLDAGIKVAIDIWGRVQEGAEVCFNGGGSLVFMDTSESPPAVTRLELYDADELQCSSITRAGTVVHVLPLRDDASIPLTDCVVTTANVLRLRDEAGGGVVRALVPFRATLSARARTASWFFVDFLGSDGWISAAFVQTEGACD